MIDADGYRANVGIILVNSKGKLFWAKRSGMDAWQFPQGGIRQNEEIEAAMYRELYEETGLHPEHVEIIGNTRNWRRYRLPKRLIRRERFPLCIGQKQIWYLLKLLGSDDQVCLDVSREPEFEYWKWVDFWYPLKEVVAFKRKVYEETLLEFEPLLFPNYRSSAN